jgi:benzoyl-CoA reductase subunit B
MLRKLEERTGVPGGFIESDLVDPRYFGKANIENRVQSFLQMLEARKGKPDAPLPVRPEVKRSLPVLKDGGL